MHKMYTFIDPGCLKHYEDFITTSDDLHKQYCTSFNIQSELIPLQHKNWKWKETLSWQYLSFIDSGKVFHLSNNDKHIPCDNKDTNYFLTQWLQSRPIQISQP